MSSIGRSCGILARLACLLGLIILSGTTGAKGQVKTAVPAPPGIKVKAAPPAPNEQKHGELTDAITLPTDRQVRRQLEAARDDYIKGEDWANAAKLLQAILNRKEDVFVQVSRKGPDGKEKMRWVSARAEANRLLATMGPKGLPFYEVLYGGVGKAKLADAKKNADPQLLAEVAQSFFHTRAGAEATDLLGTYHLDRGRPLMAALCYKRLLEREDSEQLSGLTLYKAALSFRMAGNQAHVGLARQAWDKLAAKVSSDGLRIGEDVATIDQLKEELDRATPPEVANLFDWPMFRGNASRSAQGQGSAPFLDSKWHISTTENLYLEAKRWLEAALKQRNARQEAPLPAFCPIAAGGKLLFRSYSGIHAVDCRTGNLLWDSLPLMGSLNSLAEDVEYRRQVEQWRALYAQGNNQNVLFENSSIGTLCTDESRVYAVDDLALPPYPGNQMNAPWGWNGPQITGKLAEIAGRSRLVAFDLESGKLVWERGDPQADSSELAGSYFLGPPLPLGGKLYVLTEKNSELRLVCLDAARGEVSWSQTLATARDRLINDVNRRVNAVQLAYAEGILVCPTNAGAVLGVDLLSRSLVWAFPYREKTPEPEPMAQGGLPPGVMMRRGMVVSVGNNPQRLSSDWKMTAPIIAEGKVVFTAPDGGAIHCLNLQDGDSLWQAERHEDLYVGGVFQGKVLLVGKNSVRALSLADGKKQLWQRETGTPTGLGVASGHFYYLPLRKGDSGEVCRIDLEKGEVDARSPSPKHEIPGNLLFYDGDVISQTATGVTAYEQVEAKVAQIGALLKKNAHDPVALTDRGEMRLYQGDLAGAVADLRAALSNHPPAAMLPRTRAKLYATMTDLLQRDFSAGEIYLDEYKNLCEVPSSDKATTEERARAQEEQRRRQAGYLCLLARGREGQGRLLDAFRAYLEFGQLGDDGLVTVINEPNVRARPHVWAQGRIQAMINKATADQRKPLEEEIAHRWEELQKKGDTKALRDFVAMFGTFFAAGREAIFLLAERDIEENQFIEAELYLDQLRAQQEDPRSAARALEALGRLMARKGLMEDAVHYYRILRRDYAATVVRDGKTGRDLYNELAADKRFLPYLDDLDPPLMTGDVHAKLIMERAPILAPEATPYETRGELLPFFEQCRPTWIQHNTGGTAMASFEFRLLNRNDDHTLWTVTSPPTKFMYSLAMMNSLRLPCYASGHLAVLYLGHTVVGLDLVNHKKLWERNLLEADSYFFEQPYIHPMLSMGVDGKLLLINTQGGAQRLGQIGPVTSSYVCLRSVDGLQALDPLSGRTLWTKGDLSENTEIFGDERYIYLVDVKDQKRVSIARSLRGQDGAKVDVADFSTAYQEKVRVYGGRLLVSKKQGADLTVRLYDVHAGKDLWKKSYPAGSILLRAENSELAGIVEPAGELTVLNLRTEQELLHAHVEPSYLENVNDGLLLDDANFFYVTLNKSSGQNHPAATAATNFGTMRADRVDGTIYALRRDNGKRAWLLSANKQMLLLDRFSELPILILSSRYQEPVPNLPGSSYQKCVTMTVSKNTGKRVYMPDPLSSPLAETQMSFHALRLDKQAGIIDLVSPRMTLRHWVTHKNASTSPMRADGPSGPEGSSSSLAVESKALLP
jgi:outer membrane protein assembly factor BamB